VIEFKVSEKQYQGKSLPKVLIAGLPLNGFLMVLYGRRDNVDKGLPCTRTANAYSNSDDWFRRLC